MPQAVHLLKTTSKCMKCVHLFMQKLLAKEYSWLVLWGGFRITYSWVVVVQYFYVWWVWWLDHADSVRIYLWQLLHVANYRGEGRWMTTSRTSGVRVSVRGMDIAISIHKLTLVDEKYDTVWRAYNISYRVSNSHLVQLLRFLDSIS